VLRTDGSPAYTDRHDAPPRRKRIRDQSVLAQVGTKHPELLEVIDELKRRGFPGIDRSASPPALPARRS